MEHRHFRQFQRLVSQVLLGWGAGNVVVGVAARAWPNQVVRQIGMQALVWGAINGAIAVFGMRQAGRASGTVRQEARRFRRVVAANALLDVGYLAGGWLAVRTSRGRPERVGIGVGIMIQGAFLLVFDCALTWLSGRWANQR